MSRSSTVISRTRQWVRSLHARSLRHGPVRNIGAALGALGAAGVAGAEVQALVAALVGAGDDGAVRRPPMPAEVVKAAPHRFAHAPQGHRRQRRLVCRDGGVASEAGDADVAVVLGEEGFEGPVVDGPVVRNAVEGTDSEVGRVESREVRRIEDGAAAHGVVVEHGNGGIGVVHRVVRRQLPNVGAGRELLRPGRLPIAPGAWVFGGIHPPALLQADNPHPRFGKAPRHRRPGRPGANDEHIDRVICHMEPLPPLPLTRTVPRCAPSARGMAKRHPSKGLSRHNWRCLDTGAETDGFRLPARRPPESHRGWLLPHRRRNAGGGHRSPAGLVG